MCPGPVFIEPLGFVIVYIYRVMDLERYEEEIRRMVEESSEDDDDFSAGSDDNYNPLDESSDLEDSECSLPSDPAELPVVAQERPESVCSNSSTTTVVAPERDDYRSWSDPDDSFVPRFSVSAKRPTKNTVDEKSSVFATFRKLFPYSLLLKITEHTNERIEIQNKRKDKKLTKDNEPLDVGELHIVIGTLLVMSYNHLPSMADYWSKNPAMGNGLIKSVILRDSCLFVLSKLYFAKPDAVEKSKTYYIQNMVDCLKHTFQECREDSVVQSLDESMTKFTGRTCLKQFMPLKPVKRGIKMWMRCDPLSGYAYDFNIYTGKEAEKQEKNLGERVVLKLVETIKAPDVTLCFDRFFTSVALLEDLPYPAVGTIMTNRKFLPKLDSKLAKGQSEYKTTNTGFIQGVQPK